MCALRFFYGEVLERADVVERIHYARHERRLPVVLSVSETIDFLSSIDLPRYRVLLMTIYATGLRLSEALALRAHLRDLLFPRLSDPSHPAPPTTVREPTTRMAAPSFQANSGSMQSHAVSDRLSGMLGPFRPQHAAQNRDLSVSALLRCVTGQERVMLPTMDPKQIVHSDPEIVSGTPVFVGTRVPAQALLDYLEGGETIEEFLDDFPSVSREQAVAFLEEAGRALLASIA